MPDPSPWRSRITGTGRVSPESLLAHPENFRRHPGRQRDALRGSLDTLGMIKTVIVNTTTGRVVDGHARVEEYLTAGVGEIDVTYVELTEDEERLALLALDPISALAVNDTRALSELLDEVGQAESEGLQLLLQDLARQAETFVPALDPGIGGRTVTDDDMGRAADGLDPDRSAAEQSRVLCPHCGGSFFVD